MRLVVVVVWSDHEAGLGCFGLLVFLALHLVLRGFILRRPMEVSQVCNSLKS